MQSIERPVAIPGLYSTTVAAELYTPESISSQDYSALKPFLTYVVSSASETTPLPFTEHLRKIVGKTKCRSFSANIGVDHSTLSRLLNAGRLPKLVTVARIIEGTRLSDEHAYQIVTDSATVSASSGVCKLIFSDNAPAVKGNISEQFKGYRLSRDLSQRMLADRANVDHVSVSRLESGKKDLTFINFARLVSVLGLNAQQVRGALHAVATSYKYP